MIITHEYRILPSDDQAALMTEWLELLRRQWNDALGQRLDWLTATRCPIDRCSLVSCPLPVSEAPLEPNYYRQAGSLKQIKQLFPAYRGIYAEVLQQNLMRLDKAWKAWREPDSTGKRRGRPRFKKAGELRSFTFPRINCPGPPTSPRIRGVGGPAGGRERIWKGRLCD
jgi:putative transposase